MHIRFRVAIVMFPKWTRIRTVVLLALAIGLVGIMLFNVVQEQEFARCTSESRTTGELCPKVSINLPIVIIAVALATTAFLGKERRHSVLE